MLRSFIKIAARQLWQGRLYAMINVMHTWLNNFAYHAGLPWWVYAAMAGMALVTGRVSRFR